MHDDLTSAHQIRDLCPRAKREGQKAFCKNRPAYAYAAAKETYRPWHACAKGPTDTGTPEGSEERTTHELLPQAARNEDGYVQQH